MCLEAFWRCRFCEREKMEMGRLRVRREALEIPRAKEARRVRVGPDDEGDRERRRRLKRRPAKAERSQLRAAKARYRRCHGEEHETGV